MRKKVKQKPVGHVATGQKGKKEILIALKKKRRKETVLRKNCKDLLKLFVENPSPETIKAVENALEKYAAVNPSDARAIETYLKDQVFFILVYVNFNITATR